MNETTQRRQVMRRVLVVDDDYDLAQLLREVLTFDNCEVDIATNGMEAMDRLRAEEYDAVICDLMMPRVDGEVLYNDVVREYPFLAQRFIFVTGQASRKAGFSDFVERTGNYLIEKPFDLPAFRAAVQDTVKR
ncbi:MAG: response regulator [Verrucomicrobiia bacterium]|jgi:CheY-like chemotaxis protein